VVVVQLGSRLRLWARRCGALVALAACAGTAAAEGELRLRIVGGLAGVGQFNRFEKPFWTQELARLTGGRVSAEVVAFDQAGIRGQDMLRLMQLGVVPFGTSLVSLAAEQEPILDAPNLAGLVASADELQRVLAAFRPTLEQILRDRYGVRLLAVYAYPAQTVFCRQPLRSLADLAGRRVRTSGVSQSDLVEALGGRPVQMPFAELVAAVRAGTVDCAITGTLSGNALGLHEITGFLHTQPINWGLSVFGANASAWNALPAELKQLLLRELPKLEHAILEDAVAQTAQGVACNTGQAGCQGGRPGSMQAVSGADDARRVRQLFAEVVLPRWIRRCGAECASAWNQTLGPAIGVRVAPR
jgi:TRAP-type C4-dicarboxylate transport system substrate-binding protein